MERKIELPRHRRAADLSPSSLDGDIVEVVWTTGADVLRRSFLEGQYLERLTVSPSAVRLGRLNRGAPLLNSHLSYDLRDVIGTVVPGSAKIEGGRGVAKLLLSSAPSDADIVAKVRSGVIKNISVGYAIHRVTKIAPTKRDAVPIWIVEDWEPHELGAVAVGADAAAQIRAAPYDKLTMCVVNEIAERDWYHPVRTRMRMK